jgi:hypothetical protein
MPQLMFLIGTPMNKKPSDSPKPLFWSAVISSTLPWTTSSGAVYVFFEGDSLARVSRTRCVRRSDPTLIPRRRFQSAATPDEWAG